jgi:hypothetical protein
MDTNRITLNIEERDAKLQSIYDTQEALSDLHRNNIIDTDTYFNLIDEVCDDELYAEEEEDYEDEYEYIYMVEFLGMGKPHKLYYKDAVDTHWTFDLHNDIGKVKVKYIRVPKSSNEHQSAFYNSKSNNTIKLPKNKSNKKKNIILPIPDDSIFIKQRSMDV